MYWKLSGGQWVWGKEQEIEKKLLAAVHILALALPPFNYSENILNLFSFQTYTKVPDPFKDKIMSLQEKWRFSIFSFACADHMHVLFKPQQNYNTVFFFWLSQRASERIHLIKVVESIFILK